MSCQNFLADFLFSQTAVVIMSVAMAANLVSCVFDGCYNLGVCLTPGGGQEESSLLYFIILENLQNRLCPFISPANVKGECNNLLLSWNAVYGDGASSENTEILPLSR